MSILFKNKSKNPILKLQNKFPELNFSRFVYVNYNTKSTVICPFMENLMKHMII